MVRLPLCLNIARTRANRPFWLSLVTAGLLAFSETGHALYSGSWLQITGDLRLRYEAFGGEDFNDSVHDAFISNNVIQENDEWLLTRLRLRFDANPTDFLRAYVELTDARVHFDNDHQGGWPGTRRNWEQDGLDLFQGFVDFKIQPGVHLVIGRQVLKFGSERLISEYDWWNAPYSFDAVRIQVRRDQWDLDIFAGRLVVNDDGTFNTWDDGYRETYDDNAVYGIYSVFHHLAPHEVDAFLIVRDNNNERSRVVTLGTRFHGPIGENWDYEFEFMLQPGEEKSGRDHFAWNASAEAGYTFWQAAWAPRLFAGYDYASGDPDPSDNESGGFDAPFADKYTHLGHQEFFMRRNVQNVRFGAESDLWAGIRGTVELHNFWVNEDDDLWLGMYQSFTFPRRGRDADNFAGSELDVHFTFPIRLFKQEIQGFLGYSHFFAGQYIEDTRGAADDADEFRAMLHYYF